MPKDVLNIEGALYFCTFFLGIVNSLIVQPVAAAERTVFYRERAAHMYSVLPYVLSLVCARPFQPLNPKSMYSVLPYVLSLVCARPSWALHPTPMFSVLPYVLSLVHARRSWALGPKPM